MSTVTLNAANMPLANQGGKGIARAIVQAHSLVSLEGTPKLGLSGVTANQRQQGNKVSSNGDASTSQQGSPLQEKPVDSQSKLEYSEVMPNEEVEEILSIKVIPTIDQIEEVGKIYLTKGPLLAKEEDSVIAGEPEGSWRARGQQEGLQYNGEAAWQKGIVIYCISAV